MFTRAGYNGRMPPTTHLEIERKYDVDDTTLLPTLEGLGELEAREPIELRAVYYDTGDGALARRRIVLRRRAGGEDAGWHVKLPAELGRVELGAPDAPEAPDALLDRVRAFVRERPLVEIAHVDTTRRIVRIARDGRPVAEVADDRVVASDIAGGVVRTWREWEVELLEGAPDDARERDALLDAVQERLARAGARPSASPSKLARALGVDSLADARPQPRNPVLRPVSKDGPALHAALAAIATATERIVEADPDARAGEPDGVHRLRTAVRRLRAALVAARGVLDEDAVSAVEASLRRLGAVLGRVRDLEAGRDRAARVIEARAGQLPDVRDEVRALVLDDGELRGAQAEALVALSSSDYFAFLDGLESLVARPPLGPRAWAPARATLGRIVRAEARRALRRVRRMRREDLGSMHEARKALRRVQHLVAAFSRPPAGVLGGRARTLARAAERAQRLLGDGRDALILAARLEELAGDAPEHREALELLARAERDAAAEHIDRVRREVKRFRSAVEAL